MFLYKLLARIYVATCAQFTYSVVNKFAVNIARENTYGNNTSLYNYEISKIAHKSFYFPRFLNSKALITGSLDTHRVDNVLLDESS